MNAGERGVVLIIGTQFSNLYTAVDTPCERRRGGRREVREGACIRAATILQPRTLRFLNAAALAAASPTLLFRPW